MLYSGRRGPNGPGPGTAPGVQAGPGAGIAPGSERGAAPPNAATAPARGPAPPPPPENRIYFADYRDVDGVKFPFRLRRAVGQDTTEETVFDRFRLNAKIDPRKFEVRK